MCNTCSNLLVTVVGANRYSSQPTFIQIHFRVDLGQGSLSGAKVNCCPSPCMNSSNPDAVHHAEMSL